MVDGTDGRLLAGNLEACVASVRVNEGSIFHYQLEHSDYHEVTLALMNITNIRPRTYSTSIIIIS